MAEASVTVEDEVTKLLEQLQIGKNVLLSGGAGSGKTYSLVSTINELLSRDPLARIACVTFTRAAVRQIDSRIANSRLSVSTIHDFLWKCISPFQKELKSALLALSADASVGLNVTGGYLGSDTFADKDIRYKEYLSLKDGIISHDEVLLVAHFMFEKHSKLRRIVAHRYKFVFVDEYQDTDPLVIRILLDLYRQPQPRPVVGFFGDAMQAIYDDGIGNLNSYVDSEEVVEVKKEQNRRNPRLVFELANRLRTDGIIQRPSSDVTAPNMVDGSILDGEIRFYYSLHDVPALEQVKSALNWRFDLPKQTKELNLTHNLIAPRAGFAALMQIYDGDKILDYKRRITTYIKTNAIADEFGDRTFGEVVTHLRSLAGGNSAALRPTPAQQAFIDNNAALYNEALNSPFSIFSRVYADAEQLIGDKKHDQDDEAEPSQKRDALIKHLFAIQTIIALYSEKKIADVLRMTEFRISKAADKKRLSESIATLNGMGHSTIEEVIDFADRAGIYKKDDTLEAFKASRAYIYNQVKAVKYSCFQDLHTYLEGKTVFSTQHKVKGDEFDNVLVVLDNGRWASYNFQYLFEESGTPSVLERTRKLFYVCCTRSKRSLAVYYHKPSPLVLKKAKSWFGEANVFNVEHPSGR